MSADSKVLKELQSRFSGFSPQIKRAAQFVIDNPEAVALHSMRGVAGLAQLHPNVLLRLAREIGFESYADFRSHFQSWIVSKSTTGWQERAHALREQIQPEQDAVSAFLEQELANLRQTFGGEFALNIKRATLLINEADKVYVLGLRSLFGISYCFHYLCRLFTPKTILITGLGGTNADVLRNITDKDVLLAFSHRPYARESITTIDFAREQGAQTIIVTDSKVSPALGSDGVNFVVSNTSNSLLPTALPAMAVAQLLANTLLTEGSEETLAEIRRSEAQLERFGTYLR